MRKGFTLIELLAVIILLAVIALIAAPIVINLITDSKDKALERSLDNYMHAVNVAISNYNVNNNMEDAICTIQSDGNLNCNGTFITVSVNNTKPTSGTIVIEDYEVTGYSNVVIGSKTYNSNNTQ